MRIAHLSDPHLRSGALAAEPAAGLDLALRRTLSLDPQPDCVLITGDLTHHGTPAEYEVLRELLAYCSLPLYLLIGNHDRRDNLLAAFAGTPYLAGRDQAHYAVDTDAVSLLILDSTTAEFDEDPRRRGAGRLGPEQLGWLDEQLEQRASRPIVIGLHHPPAVVGIPRLDELGLLDADEFRAVLLRHQPAVRVLAGHVHRPITASFANTIVSIAPSTFRQVELTLRPDRPTGFVLEPAGFLLHLLDGSECVTHVVPVDHTSAAFGII